MQPLPMASLFRAKSDWEHIQAFDRQKNELPSSLFTVIPQYERKLI
jgi:hypothetical protein